MKNLFTYIYDNLFEARGSSLKREDIIAIFSENPELSKYLRDEDDNVNCPEMNGFSTYFVLMKNSAKRNKLRIVQRYRVEAKNLLIKNGWSVDGMGINDGILTKKNITMPYTTTGQTYTNTPGTGRRGTTENNSGNKFEKELGANPQKCIMLIKKIDDKRNYTGNSDLNPYEDAKCEVLGGKNTRTKTSLLDIQKYGAKKLLRGFQPKNIADLVLTQHNHQIPLSLKRPTPGTSTITLWNMGLYVIPNKSSYECAVEYIRAFLKDKSEESEYINIVKTVLNDFMGTQWDIDTWTKHKSLSKQSYFPMKESDIDVNYIKDIIRYGFRTDYYMVGENKNEIYGTWIDENKVDTIVSGPLTDITLIVPNTTKLIGIEFKLNGVTYRISMRDRNSKFKFTAGEIVLQNGLTYKMLTNMGIKDVVLLNEI